MLDAVLANFVDGVTEREFDAPFMALLRARSFYDIHMVHGSFEFGKDFIAKRRDDGRVVQYVFQSKKGNIATADWDRGLGQLDRLRRSALAHPAFDTAAPRHAVLLLTGRLVGAAAVNAQEYCRDLERRGELPLDIWDRERLIEFACGAVSTGLAERTEGPLLGLIASIDGKTVTDQQLEQFSRRWYRTAQQAWPCVLEAAVVAERLQKTLRVDLACFVGLALVRAACRQVHGTAPASAEWETAAGLGRLIFATYAELLWQRSADRSFDSGEMIGSHGEPAALITHAARCVRLAEIMALRGLMPAIEGHDHPTPEQIAMWLAKFIRAQQASAHPISDRWAVSLIPPILLLAGNGFRDEARNHLRSVIVWVGDRYGDGGLGLAGSSASPTDEVRQIIGNLVPPRDVERRSECQIVGIVLDLAAFLRLNGTYRLARNDFHAVNALPSVLITQDSAGQYMIEGDDVSRDPNVRYADVITADWTEAAPHLKAAASPRSLQLAARSWDHLAVSAVLRDRHFVSAWPTFVDPAAPPQ